MILLIDTEEKKVRLPSNELYDLYSYEEITDMFMQLVNTDFIEYDIE